MLDSKKQTTITAYDGCNIFITTNREGIAFEVQAISWKHRKREGLILGSLVLNGVHHPVEGPHHIVIVAEREQHLGEHMSQVIYGVELVDVDTGEPVSWLEAETRVMYDFKAQGFTGWITNG